MKNIHDYSDILEYNYQKSNKYKPMKQSDRAAQFAPFAALSGYNALIKETQRITEEKKILDENQLEILNLQLLKYYQSKEEVYITYFKADSIKEGGSYHTIYTSINKLDDINKTIKLANNEIIKIDDIYRIIK